MAMGDDHSKVPADLTLVIGKLFGQLAHSFSSILFLGLRAAGIISNHNL
jgi:hypothetical protein